MTYSTILLEKAEGVATVTLNRPERLNALNLKMSEELYDVFTKLSEDPATKVVVITGAGRAFCSGADVREIFLRGIEGGEQTEATAVGVWTEKMCLSLRSMLKPVIASINGPAVGVGCTLPLACDIRIASEEAQLGLVFTRMGIVPEFGSTYFLPRLVGIAKACELVFTGKIINAREAKEIGLVNQVVPADELRGATYELASSLAKGASIALALSKRMLYQGLDSTLQSQLQYEMLALFAAFHTQDFAEAVKAFLEKRPPQFKGK